MDGLKHLLKASSQKVVEELFLLAFNNRDSKLTIDELKQAAEALQLSAEEAEEVHICILTITWTLGTLTFRGPLFVLLIFCWRTSTHKRVHHCV
jgi:hypothetical protein